MTDNNPFQEKTPVNSLQPLDPEAAAEAYDDAMTILPRRRFGCSGGCLKKVVIGLLILAVLFWWMFLHSVKPKISKETTYVTEPLTEDGKRVDYFKAIELDLYPPEMKTDENGYRMLIRAFGLKMTEFRGTPNSPKAIANIAAIHPKLGLPIDLQPTIPFGGGSHDYLFALEESGDLKDRESIELYRKIEEPWTLEELPMMADWLEENGPALDLIAQAARKPAFCAPLYQGDEDEDFVMASLLPYVQTCREFTRSMSTRANYRIGTGDIDGAIDDIITCKRLGRHLGNSGFLINGLVGIAIEGMAGSIKISGSPEHQPTQMQLQRLADEIKNLPPQVCLEESMRYERFLSLDILQSMAWGHHPPIVDNLPTQITQTPNYIGINWDVAMKRVNEIYDEPTLVENYELSPWKVLLLPLPGARSKLFVDAIAQLHLPGIRAADEAFRRIQCANNLHEITLAMLIYERQHGTLPPAWTVDADGRPLHSWRVLLLPYLDQQELYDELRLDEPWDSEYNRQFHEATVDVYQCPSNAMIGSTGQTAYTVVVGENTAFPGDGEGRRLDEFEPSSRPHLLLVAERGQPVCWMDPTSELTEAVAMEGINIMPPDRNTSKMSGIGSRHPGGMNVGLAGGSVQFISETLALETFEQMLNGTREDNPY